MQNRFFKHFISWLLIASPLWWTTGCYTRTEITKVDDAVLDGLHVITRGGDHYVLHRWAWDSAGGIKGEGKLLESPWRATRISRYAPPKLPLDSIARTYSETEIEVTTRSDTVYSFKEWTHDRAGNIRGTAIWKHLHYDHGTFRTYKEGIVCVPHDSLKSLKTVEFSYVYTFLTLLGVTSVITCVTIAIALQNAFTGESTE